MTTAIRQTMQDMHANASRNGSGMVYSQAISLLGDLYRADAAEEHGWYLSLHDDLKAALMPDGIWDCPPEDDFRWKAITEQFRAICIVADLLADEEAA